MAAAVAIAAPVLIVLLARQKRWLDFGLAAAAFLIALAPFWVHGLDHNILAAYVTAQAVFCGLALGYLALRWVNRRITARVAQGAPFKLTAWSGTVLAALALLLNYIHPRLLVQLFSGAAVQRLLDASAQFGYSALLHVSRDGLMQCAAAILIFTLLNVVQSWFRRRIAGGKRPVPGYLNLVAVPGVLLALVGVLYVAVNYAAPQLIPGANPGMPIGCSADGCAEA